MKSDLLLPQSLIKENSVSIRQALLLIAIVILWVYLPFLRYGGELSAHEGFYAVCADEYSPGLLVRANGEVQSQVWPLYPALVSLVHHCGVPLVISLRLVSMLMLFAWGALAAFAVWMRRDMRAGMIAFCCCCGTFFVLRQGTVGGPETLSAFLLLSAQLLFFHFGNRKANWHKAWLFSSIFLSLAFLSGGFLMLLYFAFPILFFRRPLSGQRKFRVPGFFIGMLLIVAVVLAWGFYTGLALREYADTGNMAMGSLGEYLKEALFFSLLLSLWLFPWCAVMWMPFCVALQDIDQTPVFSRYLRTLFFASALLGCLLLKPGGHLFYFLGPLAIMTALNYEAGVRRYGEYLRRLAPCGEVILAVLAVAAAGLLFLPVRYLPWISPEALQNCRNNLEFSEILLAALVIIVILTVLIHRGRKRLPVWVMILCVAGGSGSFYAAAVLPFRAERKVVRPQGEALAAELKAAGVSTLYRNDFEGMYNVLYYTSDAGIKVRRIHELNKLDPKEVRICVLSPRRPVAAAWRWKRLYNCEGNYSGLSLWLGEALGDESGWNDDEKQ